MNPEVKALLDGLAQGIAAPILFIALLIIGIHWGVIVWDWIERNYHN